MDTDEMPPELWSLHRYYIQGNQMRDCFDRYIAANVGRLHEHQQLLESQVLMGYWYTGLYVVIEGWRELKLADSKIDELLASPNVDLLRRYRHGVCHFQKDYNDARFMDLINQQGIALWIREVNRELGRYFLDRIERAKAKN
jgi:hypothetical protein